MADTTETGALTPRSGKSIVNRGILEEHAKKVGRYNRLKNWLMVFRPINPDVAKKLGEGYRGKVIFIKSKSSEFPPIGGDIPFEAELSKSFDKGKDTIDHFNQIAKQAVENIRGDTEEKQNENKKYKEGLDKKIRDGKEKYKEALQKNKNFKKLRKKSLGKNDSFFTKQQIQENNEIINKYKSYIDEYNINFFLGKKTKTISILGEIGEFELSYKKVNSAVNGHNIEVESIGKDKDGKDIFRPVFYVIKDGKYYKIKEYNDDGSIKGLEKNGLSGDDNVFPKVEIFTYSQFKINENGEISEDNPPLTADYDQLSAGPVYMTTIDAKQTDEEKKKILETIDYITGLQNDEVIKNWGIIEGNLWKVEEFLPEKFKQKYLYFQEETLDPSLIDANEIKKQIEYLILAKTIDYITGLQNDEVIKNWGIIEGNLWKVEEFLPEEFKQKYLYFQEETLDPSLIDANEIKEQIEYLKDSLLIPIGNKNLNTINFDTIDLKFCTAERDKLITYPADKYMEELRGAINSILDDDARIIGAFDEKTKSEFIEDINKDNSEKIQDFKGKYNDSTSLNNEESIRAFLNEIKNLPKCELKSTLTEKIEKLSNSSDVQFRNDWAIIEGGLWTIQEFLPEEFKQKYLYFQEETLDPNLIDIDEIKTQVYIVSKKLGLLGTCSEAITKEKMAIGERLDYGISHGLEIQHFPPESIKRRGEEFLIVDEMGKIRVVDGLEGFLSNVNYKKSRGIACLEVNPLWQIEKDENGDIVYSEEPNPIASIYSSLAGLQAITSKGLPEEEQKDFDPLGQYMYAERLYYNGDFIPYAQGIRIQNPAKFESLKTEVEIDSLTKAEEAYEKSIKQLERLMESKYLEYDFLEFCGKAPITGLASYLENHEEITDLFKNPEIKKKFTEEKFITKLINNLNNALEDKEHILENEEQQKQFVRGNFGQNISKDQIEKLTNALFNKEENNKFRKLFIENNPSGQNTAKNPSKIKNMQKLFEVLPNLNFLKGLEEGRRLKINTLDCIEFMKIKKLKVEKQIPPINKTESITNYDEAIKNCLKKRKKLAFAKINELIKYKKNRLDQINNSKNNEKDILQEIDKINEEIKFMYNKYKKHQEKIKRLSKPIKPLANQPIITIEEKIEKTEMDYLKKLENESFSIKNRIEKAKDINSSVYSDIDPQIDQIVQLKNKKMEYIYPTMEQKQKQKQEIDKLTSEIKELGKKRSRILADAKNLKNLESQLKLQEKKIQTWKDKMPSLTKTGVPGVFKVSSISRGRNPTLPSMNNNQGTNRQTLAEQRPKNRPAPDIWIPNGEKIYPNQGKKQELLTITSVQDSRNKKSQFHKHTKIKKIY